MHGLLRHARGQVRRNAELPFAIHDLVHEQFRGAERGRDTEPFMTGGEIESLVFGVWSNQRKLVRSRGSKPRPRSQRRELAEPGRYSTARSSMRVRIETSTPNHQRSNCRDEPINNCPVLRG
jgi:hypothetical protein